MLARSLTMLLATALLATTAVAQTLYTVSRDDDVLREVDPNTGLTLNTIAMDLPGQVIDGANGMAVDPTSGLVYALLKVPGRNGRTLGTIDVATGLVTDIGATGDSFAGLAFDAAGTLYGVTGDGGGNPESLFTINIGDASTNFFLALGNGDDGETIGFNPDDGRLYHASGLSDNIFESIDLGNQSITPIGLSGDPYFEALSMTWDASQSAFLMSDLDANLFTLTAGGDVATIGQLDHSAKGMAFVPGPGTLAILLLGGFVRRRRRR